MVKVCNGELAGIACDETSEDLSSANVGKIF